MLPSIRLTPHLEGLGQRLVASEPDFIRHMVQGYGSPCHIVFPGEFMKRAKAFKRIFKETGVKGTIFYASKANKSEAFLEAASQCGLGVDVASREEMTAALAAGVKGDNLMLTGPDKGSSLHRLALRQGACIALDSLEELASLVQTCRDGDYGKARVVLRYRPAAEANSRFGLPASHMIAALRTLVAEKARLQLKGFSVHLSGYDIAARAAAGAELVEFCLTARGLGLAPTLIDLGGGWPVCYVDEQEWTTLNQNLQPGHFHAERAFGGFYPYYQPVAGNQALRACLLSPLKAGETLQTLCARHNLTVAVEPGRALLDQAGLSIFRIRSMKARDDGYAVLTVEGQSFSLSEQWFGSEFLPDPLLLPSAPRLARPSFACVAGSSCLDSDMLTWRKIAFPVAPAPGDLLIYANTAGYQMDSNESSFHRAPLPKKVAVWTEERRIHWCEDSLFHQVSPIPSPSDDDRSEDDHLPHHRLDRLHASA